MKSYTRDYFYKITQFSHRMSPTSSILFFSEIHLSDLDKVGGKNSSLGEMYNLLKPIGIHIPDGFAITASAYRQFIKENDLEFALNQIINELDTKEYSNLSIVGEKSRALILSGRMPESIKTDIKNAYLDLSKKCGKQNLDVAVRSSATAEDLPSASFAGRMESFLNISTESQLQEAVLRCYSSLYTDRAIKYRHDMGFKSFDIALSVGVQQMVRSDLASSGVAFTLDPDSGFQNVIIINGCFGLGENIVQGRVSPDEWIVFKPTLFNQNFDPIIKFSCGKKEYTMIYGENTTSAKIENTIVNHPTPLSKINQHSLSNSEVKELAQWCYKIELHYGKPMDIEWAKDGQTGELFILQARPETVHSKIKKNIKEIFTLEEKSEILAKGIALGDKITLGSARILNNPQEAEILQPGEILVTDMTNPDWDPVLKKAGAIITNKGGRTSHAAIAARELGTVAIVGCNNATEQIKTGQKITVSCAEGNIGNVYNGYLKWNVQEQDFSGIKMPKTHPMLILADPDRAFKLSQYPNEGVGLLRLEFAISNSIRIHPLALCDTKKIVDDKVIKEINELIKDYKDGRDFFIDKLAEAVGLVGAAFYPKDVIVRMSDFKSNEYANLLGGKYFEPIEENPMIGYRGASRYYSNFYRQGFALECAAMKKVRTQMGLKNIKLMIPFCRTTEEAKKVLDEMALNNLVQGEDGLEIYVMIEVPSNVILADEFARFFNGFSIGSNDLTQLTLGLDRDSSLINYLFNEENEAVKLLIHQAIQAAKRNNIKIGLCGQAPSDIPAFAQFLVSEGIDSISFNPDALIRGIENIIVAENDLQDKIPF